MTSKELKDAAKKFGADLIGIAAVGNLNDLCKEDNPLSIFPQAANVIVIGRKIPRGALRGCEQGTELNNTFTNFGFMSLEDNLLAKTTYDTVIWMESHGFEAVPLFGYDCTGQPVGVPVSPGKPAPNVILQYRLMAQAAGLGETALNGLFITPEFGPRQRFAMLLTDAGLESDRPFVPHLCNDCGQCIRACPLQALEAEKAVPFGLKGFERNVAARRNELCLRCRNGAVQTNEGRFNAVERVAAACGRACIAALEERGATLEKFSTPFRSGTKQWSCNLLGERI
ncbi:MAG: Epoxyqueuosine reductase [Lentisphaerae bacterium ADurb.Bin242]|nr:MAG: Epoxyqueuosine reductase [Lentisphaerae bacterium ADurb.Bin242]